MSCDAGRSTLGEGLSRRGGSNPPVSARDSRLGGGVRRQRGPTKLAQVASGRVTGFWCEPRGAASRRETRWLQRLLRERNGGCEATHWSNSTSGSCCVRRFQAGSGSGHRRSFQVGDPRSAVKGDRRRARWLTDVGETRSPSAASVMKAMMRMSSPQLRQTSGTNSNGRASRLAQG